MAITVLPKQKKKKKKMKIFAAEIPEKETRFLEEEKHPFGSDNSKRTRSMNHLKMIQIFFPTITVKDVLTFSYIYIYFFFFVD